MADLTFPEAAIGAALDDMERARDAATSAMQRLRSGKAAVSEPAPAGTGYPSTFLDLETIARTIDGEAANEPAAGQLAVACVVYNRVAARSWWGRTPYGVCKYKWQFSCWNADYTRLADITNRPLEHLRERGWLDMALEASRIAGTEKDPSKGATHYYASYIKAPRWAAGHWPVATIGLHLFFRGIR